MKTAVVTDSNSGIFQEEAETLGVYVIPMPCKTDHNIPRKDIMVRIIIVY